MKYISSLLIAMLLLVVAQAQPMLFNYQGVARNASGQAMANQSISLRLSIIDGSAGGTAQYVETQATTTNQFGLFNVKIGAGTAVTGTMGAVTWTNGNKYIKVEMDPAGGTAYADMGTAQLLSVPFALQAGNASGLSGAQDKMFKRSVYIPAGSFGRTNASANIYPNAWGLNWKNTSEKAGFVVPRPRDWDSTTTFTVTIYFAVPSAATGASINWRLNAGGNITNSTASNAATGWDSYDYWATEDAGVMTYPAAGSYTTLSKSQTWTAHYSATYNEWYFGSGVTTADAFKSNPMWHFTFTRGASVSNGETYTGDLTVSGVEIQYTAVH